MSLADRFSPKAALAATVCWVAVLALTGSTDALLFMAPALLIAVPLFGGRYVGEELIARLAERRRRRPGERVAAAWRLPAAPPRRVARGTRLIAFSLAKRPPPARLLAQN